MSRDNTRLIESERGSVGYCLSWNRTNRCSSFVSSNLSIRAHKSAVRRPEMRTSASSPAATTAAVAIRSRRGRAGMGRCLPPLSLKARTHWSPSLTRSHATNSCRHPIAWKRWHALMASGTTRSSSAVTVTVTSPSHTVLFAQAPENGAV